MMIRKTVLVLLIFALLYFSVERSEAYKDGLYATEDDDVLPLNTTTLTKRVVRNDENLFWAVEFYNSWCGHCIHFAPTWKKLASSLKGWRDLVRIAAVDCSQSVNLDACRKFDIDRYPTMKLFSPRPENNKTDGQVMRPMESQEMDKIVRYLIDFMTELTPPSWPRLSPLGKIEDIWKEKTDKHEYVAVVVEEPTSYVGRSVILDLRHTSNVLVSSMIKETALQYGLTRFPSLYQVKPDSTFSLLTTGSKSQTEAHQLFVQTLKILSKRDGHQKLNIAVPKKNSLQGIKPHEDPLPKTDGIETMIIPLQNNSFRVTMQDLESALHYGFRQEIAICKTIGGDKFTALENFVNVLLKYFPGRTPIMKFLEAMRRMLTEVTSRSLSGEEWMARLDALQNADGFLPEVIEWECCKGSQPRYRGYPCAMWTLFHVLTVGAYRQQTISRRGTNPLEVPLAIRGYMKHFFGCEVCAKHFLQMASNLETDISDAKGTVLWLWQAHNKANLRLKGDESEDAAFPKIQYPSSALCPTCRVETIRNSKSRLKSDSDAIPTWNEQEILRFLVSFYSEKNIIVSPKLSQRVFSGGVNKMESAAAPTFEELDWWEKKQQDQDLQKVWLLRSRKRDNKFVELPQRLFKKELGVERLTGGTHDVPYDQEAKRVRGSGGFSGILSDLDLSVCVVFYLISTGIILGLYHHFIVRRNSVPCPGLCPR